MFIKIKDQYINRDNIVAVHVFKNEDECTQVEIYVSNDTLPFIYPLHTYTIEQAQEELETVLITSASSMCLFEDEG